MIALLLDAILVAVGVEAVALVIFHRATGRGIAPRALLANLAAGFLLVLAARLLARGGASAPAQELAVAGVLGAALLAHLADLAGRWRR